MQTSRLVIWGGAALLFVVFFSWYTDLGGPLTQDEIDAYVAKLEKVELPPDGLARLRTFMEEDTGRQFFMLNAIDLSENPPDVPGGKPGATADEHMAHYMEHMYAELFKRACHPTIAGGAVAPAVDLVGVDGLNNAREWTMGAFMRYRSRRSFMEIVSMPETHERHEFKIAALDKTIAYPVETQINTGDPRLLIAITLLALAALADLAFVRKG